MSAIPATTPEVNNSRYRWQAKLAVRVMQVLGYCLPLLLQNVEHVVKPKVICSRIVDSCSSPKMSQRCSLGLRSSEGAGQSLWVSCCCCKKSLTPRALRGRACTYWRTAPCPKACKAGSAPGWITSLKPMPISQLVAALSPVNHKG